MSTMRAGVVIRETSPWCRACAACADGRPPPARPRALTGLPVCPVDPTGSSRVLLVLFVIDLGPWGNHASRRGARTAFSGLIVYLNARCSVFCDAMGSYWEPGSRVTLPAGRPDRE